jgi:branched-chain amino acid transport system permease protein
MVDLIDMLTGGIAIGAIYGLVGMGFVLIIKASKILNFSQGAMMMLMAYIFWSLCVQVGLPIWLAFPGTFCIAISLGILVEKLLLRPMVGQPLLAVIMMTISLSIFFDGAVCLFWQTQTYSAPKHLTGVCCFIHNRSNFGVRIFDLFFAYQIRFINEMCSRG